MNAMQAMERSYASIKRLLRDGAFAPGARLEAVRLADQLGVSMTPVRDALHRLAGEQLVEAREGDGFHVPRYSEAALRDLYEWNSALLLLAIRTASRPVQAAEVEPSNAAEAVEAVFTQLASRAPNREVRLAIASASDRLHAFRHVEERVLEPVIGEVEHLAFQGPGQAHAVRRFHVRRMRAAPALIEARADSLGPSAL